MGTTSSSDNRIFLDAKSLAYQLPAGSPLVVLFPLLPYYSTKLRQYNSECEHHIAIRVKVLYGVLARCAITKGREDGERALEGTNISGGNTYSVVLSAASSSNFSPTTYYLHVDCGDQGESKIVVWAEVMREQTGSEKARVRAMTAMPTDKDAYMREQLAMEKFNGEFGADVVRAASASVSQAVAVVKGPPINKTPYENTTLKLDDKASAVQMDGFQHRWAEFHLTANIQQRVKQYNATSPHSIAITFKLIQGALGQGCVYRNSNDGLIEKVENIPDQWIYRLKGEFTKAWDPAMYYFELVAAPSGAKIVMSASIVQEVIDEKTGELFVRHRGMTTTPEIINGSSAILSVPEVNPSRMSSMGLSPVVGVAVSRSSIRGSAMGVGLKSNQKLSVMSNGQSYRPAGSVNVSATKNPPRGSTIKESPEENAVEMQMKDTQKSKLNPNTIQSDTY